MDLFNDDVIAAIATGDSAGGIGIVRISGKGAEGIADAVIKTSSGLLVKDFETFTMHYGKCFDYYDHQLIDEVIISVMKGPHSYTAEDVVEINCHGGQVVTRTVLKAVLDAGARLAEPGEFTKRAFLNGRIDLSQAEAVMDVINAKTEKSLAYSMNQLSGGLSDQYQRIDQELVHALTIIDASIDYPEYEIDTLTTKDLLKIIDGLLSNVQSLLSTAQTGKIVRDGIATVILGEPNVGKSSLLNALINSDRALVTDIAGTTRDVVDEYINIDGIPFHIIDTAGIRETQNKIEALGVKKSLSMLDQADLILLVYDVSRGTSQDKALPFDINPDKTVINVYNKYDLAESNIQDEDGIVISTKTHYGLINLKNKMKDEAMHRINKKDNENVLSNLRHIHLLNQVNENLLNVQCGLNQNIPIDLTAIDLKNALDCLREITGRNVGSDIIDSIFAHFCLGK
ncbi:MAG: tRNA uridine-5-carboxymethylaminomethyl(34) synthesis GTPase MnmE [Eubacteriaceae bacterium]|nr:tRNA uridine-5-carboxymethylaminomethyl(34) synthesis GTPase MnmE [Eubacteriaceae bacterium]MDD4507493.1 tRNA uridine-5-carboxymethylaminomethyl(34) synthesis GTPase MnmE [Eubacteriaceae bacterium]